jgi:anaerobic ribonucleoside-triphosphate reductase
MESKKKIVTEVYDRVCGYFRPTSQANNGKREEISQRARYNPNRIAEDCSEYL